MSFVLFLLGLAAAAAGVLAIGFGIPINEFSLGNTLILAGTTALASGLIVVALAITNRQLKKIAEILISRPASFGPGRSSEDAEPASGGGRIAAARAALPLGGEPRGASYAERPQRNAPAGPAPLEEDEEDYDLPHFEQPPLRQPSAAPRNAAPVPVYDPIEDVPVSPRTQPRIPGIGSPPPVPPAAEAGPRGWRPPGLRQPAAPEPVRQEPSINIPGRSQRPAPEAQFDAVWPADRRPERIEPQHDFAPEPAPAVAPQRPTANGEAKHREVAPPLRAPVEPAPVSVLKSGVVDGMAYTLYTDGSIEAELAQGVVRFGSIEELRNHLEKGA